MRIVVVIWIIVVGGGVGGLELVIKLGCIFGCKGWVNVILVDCNLSYFWKFLLYEVVIGLLDEGVDVLSYCVYVKNYSFDF